jgi:hypothetical protein
MNEYTREKKGRGEKLYKECACVREKGRGMEK